MRYRYRSEEEMKDSGAEWIGKIPNEWGLCKVKNIVKVKDGTHDTPKYVDPSTDARPLVTSKDVKNGKIDLSEVKYISYNDYKLINTRSDVTKGDVIMPMIGTVGNPTIVDIGDEFSIKNVALFKTCNNQNLSKFITYIFESIVIKEQLNLLTRGGVQNFASLSMLQNLKLVDIPNKCLNIILSFLDEKTAQFDTIISKKEALIQTLEEAKKSLISEVVTGKVRVIKTSDGYELVERKKEEMKESEVEWIEKIPNEWNIKRSNYIFKFSKGLSITKENLEDDGIPCINYGEIHSKYGFEVNPMKDKLKCVNKEYLNTNLMSLIKYGDFVFCDTSEDIEGCGNFTYLNKEANIFAGYHTIIARPIERINSRYMAYLFDSDKWRIQIRSRVSGIKVYSITQSILKATKVILPSLSEQEIIVNYLDKKFVSANLIINNMKLQIEKLKEAKQALISEAVTGKIEILD